MKKKAAIKAFGNGAKLARSMGVSRQYISQLPDELPQKHVDWIVGAALRCNVALPYNDKLSINLSDST